MRIALYACAALVALPAAACADSLTVTSVTEMEQPSGVSIGSTASQSWTPQVLVTFSAFGRTCTWRGSKLSNARNGCDYSITLNNTRQTMSNPGSNAPPGTSQDRDQCTPPSEMMARCGTSH